MTEEEGKEKVSKTNDMSILSVNGFVLVIHHCLDPTHSASMSDELGPPAGQRAKGRLQRTDRVCRFQLPFTEQAHRRFRLQTHCL